MEILQLLIIIFVLFASSRALIQFRKNVMSLSQFMFWQAIWLVLLLFGLFSSYFQFVSDLLGIQRLVDAFIYLSIGLLFYLVYRIYVRLENLNHDMTVIARSVSKVKKK